MGILVQSRKTIRHIIKMCSTLKCCLEPIEYQDGERINYFVKKEREALHKALIDNGPQLVRDKVFCCPPISIIFGGCIEDEAKAYRKKLEEKLDEAVRQKPKGVWKEFKNMNLLNQGGKILVTDWRNFTTYVGVGSMTQNPPTHKRHNRNPLEDLQRISESYRDSVIKEGCNAITIYPGCDHAVLRQIDFSKKENKCKPAKGYECITYIYTSQEEIDKAEATRKKKAVEAFLKASQADEDAAKYYLEAVDYDYQEAIKNFFKGPDETKVKKFIEATQADRITACLYLEGAENDLKSALKNFFSGAPAAPLHMQKRQASPTPSMLSINIKINNENTLKVDVPQ